MNYASEHKNETQQLCFVKSRHKNYSLYTYDNFQKREKNLMVIKSE